MQNYIQFDNFSLVSTIHNHLGSYIIFEISKYINVKRFSIYFFHLSTYIHSFYEFNSLGTRTLKLKLFAHPLCYVQSPHARNAITSEKHSYMKYVDVPKLLHAGRCANKFN